MSKFRVLVAVFAAACLTMTSVSSAALFATVDGTVNVGEYEVGSTDSGDVPTVFNNTGLDIDRVQFRTDMRDGEVVFLMGFNTMTPFDTGSPANPTLVTLSLFDDDGAFQYKIDFLFTGDAEPDPVQLVDENFTDIIVADGDGEAITDDDFEVGVKASYLSDVFTDLSPTGTNEFLFSLRVGDLFSTHIDQHADRITTETPEPATLAVMGLGTVLLVRRRK